LLRATLEHEIRQLDRAAHVGDPNDALYASSRRRLLEQVGRESRDGAIVCPQFACRSAVEALEKLGHEPYARGFWLHTGPIGKTSTVVRIHGTNERNGVAFTSARIATPPGLVRFEGWRHDQIALVDAPADTDAVMRMFPLASEGSGLRVLRRPLAIVWSWARLRDDGPGLMWLAPRGGEPFVHHTFCPVTPTASERHTLDLALALIRGEHKAPRGRPLKVALSTEDEALAREYWRRKRHDPNYADIFIFTEMDRSEGEMRRIKRQALDLGVIDKAEYERVTGRAPHGAR